MIKQCTVYLVSTPLRVLRPVVNRKYLDRFLSKVDRSYCIEETFLCDIPYNVYVINDLLFVLFQYWRFTNGKYMDLIIPQKNVQT